MGEVINLADRRLSRWAKREMFNEHYTFDEWFALMDSAGYLDDEDKAEEPLLRMSYEEVCKR